MHNGRQIPENIRSNYSTQSICYHSCCWRDHARCICNRAELCVSEISKVTHISATYNFYNKQKRQCLMHCSSCGMLHWFSVCVEDFEWDELSMAKQRISSKLNINQTWIPGLSESNINFHAWWLCYLETVWMMKVDVNW